MKSDNRSKSSSNTAFSPLLTFGAILAAAVTFIVFFTALDNQFVALDDYEYIINNSHIEKLDWNTVWWAFTSFYQGNWHPLTMLSYALDRHLWGFDPAGYHLINILLHSFVVFVVCHLFSCILRIAGNQNSDSARSQRNIVIGGIVGALFFGLHPLRVESVVWISERKDVLCLLFITSSVYFYLRYAQRRMAEPILSFRCYGYYMAALILAVLAMMSKPLAVSMPFILCIIDWYPLRRWSGRDDFVRSNIDKIPFLMFSVVLSVLTMFAQQVAMKVFDELGLLSRVLVACKALFFYLAKTLWPSDLAAFYVHPGDVASTAPVEYLVYAVLAAALLMVVIFAGRSSRMLPALFCFYFVTLFPMLGLVQVGGQWVADRYSYLPALGLSLLWGGGIVWLLNRLDSKRNIGYSLPLAFVFCQLLIYGFLTIRQIPVWSNTETLATRIIDLQPQRTGAVYYARAVYRNHGGQFQLALEDIVEAMKIALRQNRREYFSKIAFEQAQILKNLGRLSEALTMAEWGIQSSIDPPSADAMNLHEELKRLNTGAVRQN